MLSIPEYYQKSAPPVYLLVLYDSPLTPDEDAIAWVYSQDVKSGKDTKGLFVLFQA